MPSSHSSSRSSGRQCWICYATEEDDPGQVWTMPCKCKGTTKWVHQRCLLMWIDLKSKSKNGSIACPQCKMEYTIFYPQSNILVAMLDKLDQLMFRVCPFMAGAIMILLVYWTGVAYGIVVLVQQVLGPEQARQVLDSNSAAVLLLTLPTMPVLLLGFNFFQWEERMLLCLRKYGPRIPLLRHLLPAPVPTVIGHVNSPQASEEMTFTRLIVTSLLAPGVSAIVGNVLFKKTVNSPIKRALLGFLVMNIAHGVVGMYHKQMLYKKYRSRRVMDYNPPAEAQRVPQAASNSASTHPDTVS